MPYSPKKPCRYPGCVKLTHQTYCEQHAKLVTKNYDKYQRPIRTKKSYGRTWQRARNHYIRLHPFCEMCLRSGRYSQATEVHHVLPISQGGTNAQDNLMALYKPCHSRITAEMDDRWHQRRQTYHFWWGGAGKIACLRRQRTGWGPSCTKNRIQTGD